MDAGVIVALSGIALTGALYLVKTGSMAGSVAQQNREFAEQNKVTVAKLDSIHTEMKASLGDVKSEINSKIVELKTDIRTDLNVIHQEQESLRKGNHDLRDKIHAAELSAAVHRAVLNTQMDFVRYHVGVGPIPKPPVPPAAALEDHLP